MRYRLRTLLILLAVAPPIIGWYVWPSVRDAYVAWRRRPNGRNGSSANRFFRAQWGADSELSPAEWLGRRVMQHQLYSSQIREMAGLLKSQEAYVQELATALAARGDSSEELCRELGKAVKKRHAVKAKLEQLQAEVSRLQAVLANSATPVPAFLNANQFTAEPVGGPHSSPEVERAMLHEVRRERK